jgi:hypothetical protein
MMTSPVRYYEALERRLSFLGHRQHLRLGEALAGVVKHLVGR